MSEGMEAPPPEPAGGGEGHSNFENAPRNPVDSETLPGVQERLGQLKENPSLLDTAIKQQDDQALLNARASLAELLTGTNTEQPATPATEAQDRYAEMSTADLQNGIEDGSITETDAVRAVVRKSYQEQRELHAFMAQQPGQQDRQDIHAKQWAEIEARYKPLLDGDPKTLTQYSLDQASRYMTFDYPNGTDNTNYEAASHWYDMAGKFAREQATASPATGAAERQTTGEKPAPEQTAPTPQPEANRLTEQQQQTLAYLQAHPEQLTALSTLQKQTPESIHALIENLQEQKKTLEKTSEAAGGKEKNIVDLLLGLLLVMVDDLTKDMQ
jgi:hypothetical protein